MYPLGGQAQLVSVRLASYNWTRSWYQEPWEWIHAQASVLYLIRCWKCMSVRTGAEVRRSPNPTLMQMEHRFSCSAESAHGNLSWFSGPGLPRRISWRVLPSLALLVTRPAQGVSKHREGPRVDIRKWRLRPGHDGWASLTLLQMSCDEWYSMIEFNTRVTVYPNKYILTQSDQSAIYNHNISSRQFDSSSLCILIFHPPQLR